MAKQPAISATRQRHLQAIQADRESLFSGLAKSDDLGLAAKCSYLASHVAIRLQTIYSMYLLDSLKEHTNNIERYYMEPYPFTRFLAETAPCMLDVDEATRLLAAFDEYSKEDVIGHEIDWEKLFDRVCDLLRSGSVDVTLKQLPRIIVMNDGEWPLQITFDWPEPNTP